MQSFTLDDVAQATPALRDQQRRVQRWTRAAASAVERRPMQSSECGMARGAWQFMGLTSCRCYGRHVGKVLSGCN
ncbi:hypothetical protein AU05_00750 [Ectopseudomonas composti]|uniref:Uncharacterized protein n=1 Tax=Ectopseudomonas composti TaxID=658457 RepID=A0ABN0SGF9_9GAMM|nr:hypothetical protein AU05_00750 [Pseudomonas composti]